MSNLDMKGQADALVASTVSNDNDVQRGYRINVAAVSFIDDDLQRLVRKNAWCGRALKIPDGCIFKKYHYISHMCHESGLLIGSQQVSFFRTNLLFPNLPAFLFYR